MKRLGFVARLGAVLAAPFLPIGAKVAPSTTASTVFDELGGIGVRYVIPTQAGLAAFRSGIQRGMPEAIVERDAAGFPFVSLRLGAGTLGRVYKIDERIVTDAAAWERQGQRVAEDFLRASRDLADRSAWKQTP